MITVTLTFDLLTSGSTNAGISHHYGNSRGSHSVYPPSGRGDTGYDSSGPFSFAVFAQYQVHSETQSPRYMLYA